MDFMLCYVSMNSCKHTDQKAPSLSFLLLKKIFCVIFEGFGRNDDGVISKSPLIGVYSDSPFGVCLFVGKLGEHRNTLSLHVYRCTFSAVYADTDAPEDTYMQIKKKTKSAGNKERE